MKHLNVGSNVKSSLRTKVLHEHISNFDTQLNAEFIKNGPTEKYFTLVEKRGISYSEFQQIFDKQIKEDHFLDYLPFLFAGIDKEYGYFYKGVYRKGRKDITDSFLPSKEGYIDFLSTFPSFINQFSTEKETTIPLDRLFEHAYINGASGSGKSTLIKQLMYHLSKDLHSLVLIDPQGKLASEIKGWKHLRNDRIVFIKPTLNKDYTPVLNVLEQKTGSSTSSKALKIARVISILSKGELSNPMVSLLRPCISLLIENDMPSLSELKRFFLKEENRDLINLGLQHHDPEFRSTFKRINSGYFSQTREAIVSKLDVLLQDNSFTLLTNGNSSFSITECVNNAKLLIFDLSELDFETINAFGRLVAAEILHIIASRSIKEVELAHRTFLFIDEMHNFLSPDLIKILDEARQKKLHLILAHQRIGQLKTRSSSSLDENYVDAILGNTAVKIIGQNDSPETINVLSTKLGVPKEKLTSIPNYEFILRIRGHEDQHFRSSDKVNDASLYLSENEIKERDQFMLKHYYRKIETTEAVINSKNEIIQKPKKASPLKGPIFLDDDDF